MSSKLEFILGKLNKVKPLSTGGYTAICPAHDDKHHSLSIAEEGDKILLKCFAKCTTEQILQALGLEYKDLFAQQQQAPKVPETVWPIKDRQGNTVAEHIRFEKPDGKGYYWKRNNKKGLGDLKTADLPLYGVDRLKDPEYVIVCEGEKATDSLIRRDHTAVGTVTGASSTPSEFPLSEISSIKNIYLWPDNDEPGFIHMNRIAERLVNLGASPFVILLEDAQSHADAADYHDDITELLTKAIPWDGNILLPKDNLPQITHSYQSINYQWDKHGLRILIDRYNEDGHAELSFYSMNGSSERRIHFTRGNLLSTGFVETVLRKLTKKTTDIPWDDLLSYVIDKTMDTAREGAPVDEIWPDYADTMETEYLLYPVLYKNHPSVMFGDYGSLKSWTSLLLAYVVQLPYADNKYGFATLDKSTTVLFLDYEDDKVSFQKRWTAISRGLAQPAMPLKYRHMTSPLHDNVHQIKTLVERDNIGLIIVDSLGPAARGNLNDTEPAIKYHAALREIGVTSLTLAHTAKDNITKKRTIFGSVFFTNLARSVWECKCEQDVGENEAIISIKHTKANLSRLHNPIGLQYTFDNNATKVMRYDLSKSGLEDQLPIPTRILNLLADGPLSNNEICEKLGESYNSIKSITHRMGQRNQLVKVGGAWGLSYEG